MKNLIQKIVISLLIVFPFAAHASFVSQNYSESTSSFSLLLNGGEINTDHGHNINVGSLWSISIQITEDDSSLHDVLTLNGTARHIIAPHAEAPGGIFNFNFLVNSSQYNNGTHSAPIQGISLNHETHDDVFFARLTFDIEDRFFGENINFYRLDLSGEHLGTSAVPLPASIWFLMSAITIMMGIVRKKV